MFIMLSNIPANTTRDLMETNDNGRPVPERFIPGPAVIQYALEANAVGCSYEIYVGGVRHVDRSVLDAGGTTGVMPNLDQKASSFETMGGTLQVLAHEEAGVATTDIMLALDIVR